MELLSAEFFSARLAIIIIDLVLAGDNAVVIALAARSLPPDLRKKAIIRQTGRPARIGMFDEGNAPEKGTLPFSQERKG